MSEQILHKGLTPERWNQFPLERRLGMIVSEFVRAINLAEDNDGRDYVRRCYQRARELLVWTAQGVVAGEAVAARLAEAIRAIDETDFESWDASRLVEQSKHLAALVNEAAAKDHAA